MCFFEEIDFAPMEVASPVTSQAKPAFKPHAKFSYEDDEVLRKLVAEFGENKWVVIAEHMPGRNPRQCKERWMNYLCPTLNRSPWSPEEDRLLIAKQKELGSKWVKISQFFENRTDAMVKNRFQVLKRKELKEQELQARREQYLASSASESSAPCSSPVVVEHRQTEESTPEDAPFLSFFNEREDDMFLDFVGDEFAFVL